VSYLLKKKKGNYILDFSFLIVLVLVNNNKIVVSIIILPSKIFGQMNFVNVWMRLVKMTVPKCSCKNKLRIIRLYLHFWSKLSF